MALTRRKDGRFVKKKTINGKVVYFYSNESTSKKAEKDIEQQFINYSEKENQGITIAQLCEEWEEWEYPQIKYQSMERYKSHVRRFKEFFNDLYIKELTAQSIDHFLNSLCVLQFSTKTIKDQFGIVRQILKYAIIKNYIDTDPSEFLSAPKGVAKKERCALTDEAINLIKSDTATEFGKIANFLLYTGLRKGELLALTYADIDYNNSRIFINKSVEYVSNSPRITTPKTNNGVRIVPLPNILKPLIVKGKHLDSDVIFNHNNQIYKKSYFREHWNMHCKKLGIVATPHQLRHTYATMLFEWNISEKDVQTIMGHSDISITHNIYTHLRESHMNKTTNEINNHINF